MKTSLAITLILFLLSACASSVTRDIEVEAEASPKANFSGYKTYAWLGSAAILNDPQGRWEPPEFDADAEIKFLIDRELRGRGMSETSSNPDIIVIYAAGIDMESMDLATDPATELEVLENIPRGALTVILVDGETGLAIWAGLATANIAENPSSDVQKQRLDYAVTQMFKKLK